MADVFISYSRQDRALAEALAARLEGEGRTVWWDTNLLGGDQFRQVIVEQLNAAKSVVVIWTPNSVKSEWVISEATRAAAQKKFVPVKSADLALTDIPPPFDTYHTVENEAFGLIRGTLPERPPWRRKIWLRRAAFLALGLSLAFCATYAWNIYQQNRFTNYIVVDDWWAKDLAKGICEKAKDNFHSSCSDTKLCLDNTVFDQFSQSCKEQKDNCERDKAAWNSCNADMTGNTQVNAFDGGIKTQFFSNPKCSGLKMYFYSGPSEQNQEVLNIGTPHWWLMINFNPGLEFQNWSFDGVGNATGQGTDNAKVICR